MARDDARDDDEALDGAFDDEWFASALVLTPRKPFVDWAIAQEPRTPTAEAEAGEMIVVLTPELAHEEDRDAWLAQYHEELLAHALAPWTEDESRWPDLSLATLRSWFDVKWSTTVDDMSGAEILPPVTCGPVSLPALVTEYKAVPTGTGLFLDVQNGDIVSFSPEELDALEHENAADAGLPQDEFAALVQLFETATLIPLPSPGEDAEASLMETFADSVRVPAIRNRLMSALDSKKPARRFQETVDTSGLRSRWLAYRDDMITAAMHQTLQRFGVPFNEPDPHVE